MAEALLLDSLAKYFTHPIFTHTTPLLGVGPESLALECAEDEYRQPSQNTKLVTISTVQVNQTSP